MTPPTIYLVRDDVEDSIWGVTLDEAAAVRLAKALTARDWETPCWWAYSVTRLTVNSDGLVTGAVTVFTCDPHDEAQFAGVDLHLDDNTEEHADEQA